VEELVLGPQLMAEIDVEELASQQLQHPSRNKFGFRSKISSKSKQKIREPIYPQTIKNIFSEPKS
jgi:hypothetical protein